MRVRPALYQVACFGRVEIAAPLRKACVDGEGGDVVRYMARMLCEVEKVCRARKLAMLRACVTCDLETYCYNAYPASACVTASLRNFFACIRARVLRMLAGSSCAAARRPFSLSSL